MHLQYLISFALAFAIFCLGHDTSAYPVQHRLQYPHLPQEYPDEEFYYPSKPGPSQYYDAPARYEPEVYGRIPYPYYYDPYGHYNEEDPARQEERIASLPVGQETWYENEVEPRWKPENLDDINAAFMDNLILTQMAQDAQRRRQNSKSTVDYEENDSEDEDVRELKALAGKPLYHVPKTAPRHEDEDYPVDDEFINWNGNKRSVVVEATTLAPHARAGEDEVAVPQPAQAPHRHHQLSQDKKDASVYHKIAHMLASDNTQESSGIPRRLEKRFVSGDKDLVAELRGLKHRIPT